jgi:capsule polysaccharide export protein KpsE/RkpR
VRAFDDRRLWVMNEGASGEVEDLVAEVRRLYAEEEARARGEAAMLTLLSSAHQQLHAAARTLEMALRVNAPQEPPKAAEEPQRRRPRMLGEEDEQPATGEA